MLAFKTALTGAQRIHGYKKPITLRAPVEKIHAVNNSRFHYAQQHFCSNFGSMSCLRKTLLLNLIKSSHANEVYPLAVSFR